MTGEIARHQFQQINPDHSRHSSRNPLFQDNTSALKRFTFIVFKTNFLLRTVEIRISGFLQNLENPINTQPPNQEHQSPQEVWICGSGKKKMERKAKMCSSKHILFTFSKFWTKTVQRSKSKILGTEEYRKGKIETICKICQIPKPFFEQKTDCVLLYAQLKWKGLVIEIHLATQLDWIGLLTEDNFENK